MILRDIDVFPELDEYPLEFTSRFRYQSRALCVHVIWDLLKPLKLKVPFSCICVVGTAASAERLELNSSNVASAYIAFDHLEYQALQKESERQEYIAAMMLRGVQALSRQFALPVDGFRDSTSKFAASDYMTTWIHSKRRIASLGASVELSCRMNEQRFTLALTCRARDGSVCETVLLETEPDELHFHGRFDKLLVRDDHVIVTAKHADPLAVIDLSDLLSIHS